MSSEALGGAGLAGRYATALFDLADAEGQLDEVASDLAELGAMIAESSDLARLIRSPVISRSDQHAALGAVLEAAGMSELTRKFAGVVAQNRRLFVLPAMIRAYQTLLAERRGEASAEVISAQPLSDKQLHAIGETLRQSIGTKVSIEASVDESLLGGLVVRLGSRMIDSSLKTKLQQLRLAMKGVG